MTKTQTDFDVIVLGSGCAALSAALHAASEGLSVCVCEKTAKLGGTSAMSAGGIWVAANHLQEAEGLEDSVEEALGYVQAVAPEGWEETPKWRALLEAGPKMLKMLEEKTPLRFRLTGEPDPYADVPGARTRGRMLSVLPLSRFAAKSFAFKVRSSTLPEIFTYHDVLETDLYHKPVRSALGMLPQLMGRIATLSAGKGTALMLGMVRGCLDAGVTFLTQTPGVELIEEDGRIAGVIVETDGGRRALRGRLGTVIATGGFEWNAEMMSDYFAGPVQFRGSSAGNTGDGHRIAARAGAALGRMDQANVTAAIPKRYEGRIHGMPVPYHAEQNAIVVDRTGKRFWDELHVNFGEALVASDPQTGERLHLPAYVITDSRYLGKAPLVRIFSRLKPGWLMKAPTIEALADKIGIDAATLSETVTRFNGFAATGVDEDFGRGKTAAHQKADKRKRAGLEPIHKPPFIAVEFNPSIMTTKGGPETDEFGRALRADGSVIEGLYCAGASMANPIGTRGVGAGTTLGPFMSWGWLCAEDMLRRSANSRAGA